MRWEVHFYQDAQGNMPVQDFIIEQSAKVQAKILKYIDLLEEFGLSLGRPYVEKLKGSDVWELKMRHGSDYYRILYFASSGHRFVLLHAFLKKTEKTPQSEIDIAQRRIFDSKARHGR